MDNFKAHKSMAASDFEAILNVKLNRFLKQKIASKDFRYEEIDNFEYEKLIIFILKKFFTNDFILSGEQRREEWNKGWQENLNNLTSNADFQTALIPKYFNKYSVVRWQGKFIKPISEGFERESLYVILLYLADKYLRANKEILEFGCGTGHNLLQVRSVNSSAKLVGLDWAKSSQKIIETMRSEGVDNNIYGVNFDYFNPDYDINFNNNCSVLTIASLEQVGQNWKAFLNYLLKKKPGLCIHIEPIAELLNEDILLDFLSIEYFKRRNYLSGFLSYLRTLALEKKIEIIEERRTNLGSLFIEGYSIVVWRPL